MIQVNVNNAGQTLFNVEGGINQVSRVLIAYFDSMGQFENYDEEKQLSEEIGGGCASAALGKDTFLWVNDFLINFSRI